MPNGIFGKALGNLIPEDHGLQIRKKKLDWFITVSETLGPLLVTFHVWGHIFPSIIANTRECWIVCNIGGCREKLSRARDICKRILNNGQQIFISWPPVDTVGSDEPRWPLGPILTQDYWQGIVAQTKYTVSASGRSMASETTSGVVLWADKIVKD